ncbi:AEC family transporter [uncultured Methylobacterium sp.]|uniref:AEC family transporter n=1 Tax=uncultured Methylobacterium sp. TaxID=157278 RepID=UPI0035CCA675
MVEVIASALLPILFVVGLGYVAARWNIIPGNAAGAFAAFVVKLALPLSLFLAAAKANPSDLSNTSYVLAFVVGFMATFAIGIVLGYFMFKHDLRASTIQGLICGFPSMAYCGPPVLLAVVGPSGILAVLVGNLVTSLVMMPIALVLLHDDGNTGPGPKQSRTKIIGVSLLGAVRQPLVWLPVLGAACSLLHVPVPAILLSMTNEVGSAAGGVALFTLGLMLAGLTFKMDREVLLNVFVKNILQPALLLGAALAFGLRGALAQEVFLMGVLPAATLVPALAHTNTAYESEASLSAMASTLFSIISIAAGIAIAKAVL